MLMLVRGAPVELILVRRATRLFEISLTGAPCMLHWSYWKRLPIYSVDTLKRHRLTEKLTGWAWDCVIFSQKMGTQWQAVPEHAVRFQYFVQSEVVSMNVAQAQGRPGIAFPIHHSTDFFMLTYGTKCAVIITNFEPSVSCERIKIFSSAEVKVF